MKKIRPVKPSLKLGSIQTLIIFIASIPGVSVFGTEYTQAQVWLDVQFSDVCMLASMHRNLLNF